MAQSLIALLTRHEGKAPDEIVAQLKNRGWVYLGDITAEDHAYLFDRKCVLIAYHDRRDSPWHVVQGPGYNWDFWFDMEYCHSDWHGAWACRIEDYEDGSVPDRTPEQVRN